MSIPVDLARLREEVARFGSSSYLLTVTDDDRPHAVAVSVAWAEDSLRVAAGRTTLANASRRPSVSLLWPPVDDEGFSLIVDGQASVDEAEALVSVHPDKAVLHRSRADGAGSDCVTLRPA
jgi:hypothetical protein